ncbi:MAG TPA: HAD family hydrolase [Terriglobales bacterium]|nr:HAD family hydrolase [Terriglobales bacterium]
MSYRLLVCDLDGTLLDNPPDLDLALVDGLRRAMERGLIFTIATGRMPPGTLRYRDELGVTAPMIFYNGALVRDHEAGQDLMTLTLPRGILWQAHDVFAHAPVDPLFYRDDRLYCLAESFAVRKYSEEQRVPLEVIDTPSEFLRLGGFVKTLLIGHPATLPTVRADLEAVLGDAARLVMTRADYLEIIPPAASKGAAIRFLADHMGVPLAEAIGVGDQENDLEMIKAAGLGIAMPRAPETVRQAAGRVAPPDDHGGLLSLFTQILPQYFT